MLVRNETVSSDDDRSAGTVGRRRDQQHAEQRCFLVQKKGLGLLLLDELTQRSLQPLLPMTVFLLFFLFFFFGAPCGLHNGKNGGQIDLLGLLEEGHQPPGSVVVGDIEEACAKSGMARDHASEGSLELSQCSTLGSHLLCKHHRRTRGPSGFALLGQRRLLELPRLAFVGNSAHRRLRP